MSVTSSYLKYLPDIFEDNVFLGHFLLAFEQVLTGMNEFEETSSGPEKSETKPLQGLEDIIKNSYKLFNPLEVEEIVRDISKLTDGPDPEEKEFLQWLAGWTALSLRSDWTPKQQREFLANIVPLYRFRGTKENLIELLRIYTREKNNGSSKVENTTVNVIEPEDIPFQISDRLQIGINTQIGGTLPHYFKVEVKPPGPQTIEFRKRQYEIISALVDLQKPAHTHYDLTIFYETIQIGNPYRSIIGENMILGNLNAFIDSGAVQIGNPYRSVIGKNMLLKKPNIFTSQE